MRICVISSTIFSVPIRNYGGLEEIAYQCAKGLAARGHDVTLIAPQGSECPQCEVLECLPPGHGEEQAWGGCVYKNPNGEDVRWPGYWPKLLEFNDGGCVIDHSWAKWSYMLKAEGRLTAPILGVMHAPVHTMYKDLPPVDKPCMVCISEDQRAHFEALHSPRTARTCYNGADGEFYKPLDTPRGDRFLYLARFSTIKGPDIALRACKDAGVGLDLIGDTSITNEPELFERCKQMADGKQLRIVGPVSRGETVWWYSQALALLHPNERFREPFGLAPVEAMLCFPGDVKVSLGKSRIERPYSRLYTGVLWRVDTDKGEIECTPEHPFLTQRGWVAAKDLTLDDTLVKVISDGRSGVDGEGIGSLVAGLSHQGSCIRGEKTWSSTGLGYGQGEEAETSEKQSEVLYTKRGADHPQPVPGARRSSCGRRAGEVGSERAAQGQFDGHPVRTPTAGLYEGGDGTDPRRVRYERGCGPVTDYAAGRSEYRYEGESYGDSENTGREAATHPGKHVCRGAGVSGGRHRRGGICITDTNPDKEKSNSEHPHQQYLPTTHSVGQGQDSHSQLFHLQQTGVPHGDCASVAVLGVRHPWHEIFIAVPSTTPVHGGQEASDGNTRRVEFDPTVHGSKCSIAEEVSRLGTDDSVHELARVRHISRREVTGLPVFNLGTSTGTYYANGFLVHNCGCPTVAWDYGAMRETICPAISGLLVRDYDALVEAIKHYHANPPTPGNRAACRDWALGYSVDRMVERYEELCHEAVKGGW